MAFSIQGISSITGVSSLDFGEGGTPPGDGGGGGGTVVFDAIGGGAYAYGTNVTFTHTAASGAYVIVATGPYETQVPTSVTYDGAAMTLLGNADGSDAAYGWISFFGISNVPGGAKTVSVNFSSNPQAVVNSISFTGVGSVGTPDFVGMFSSGNLSQSVSCSTGEMIVQGFAWEYQSSDPTTLTGGTNVYLKLGKDFSRSYGGLALNYSETSDIFVAQSNGWAITGGAIVLSP